MDLNRQYVGSKWYKCDLHLHTTASACFQDQTVTAEQWVDKAIEMGLDCVAVTDHNTGNGINEIKAAAEGKSLVVFPGVEITCDTSKVHLLIIFDSIKSGSDVNDFLIECGINRKDFGKQNTYSSKSILEIASIADGAGAVIIPAHIDQYNGLDKIGDAVIDQFYNLPYINAVQVVHKELMIENIPTANRADLSTRINGYYNPSTAIDIMKRHKPVQKAIRSKLAITTFSDNPHEIGNPKHGLNGIGSRFTYIKMGESPSVEGLRQAFLMPDYRVWNDFEGTIPYNLPFGWFKSLSIINTSITSSSEPLLVNFNPQLNTIIGGRGSGKSSILKFIRGAFNRTEELDLFGLGQILSEHHSFYKHYDDTSKKGVLCDDTEILVEYFRDQILYKIHITNIRDSENQSVEVFRYDGDSNEWIVEDVGFVELFEYDHYSQKQIYEIAQEPNVLKDRIDGAIDDIATLKIKCSDLESEYFQLSQMLSELNKKISRKSTVLVEIKDFESQISKFMKSGLSALMTNQDRFTKEKASIDDFYESLISGEGSIGELVEQYDIIDFDNSSFDKIYQEGLSKAVSTAEEGHNKAMQKIKEILIELQTVNKTFGKEIMESQWGVDFAKNTKQLEDKKEEAGGAHIKDIASFHDILKKKTTKEKELKEIMEAEESYGPLLTKLTRVKDEHFTARKEITTHRNAYVGRCMNDDKINVSVQPFRNKEDLILSLRRIIQRDSLFDSSLNNLMEQCFNGNAETGIEEVKEVFRSIRRGEDVEIVDGHFVNLVDGFNQLQYDQIELLYPEDDIVINYKPVPESQRKPLSSASAGQKTTAILTIILSQGNTPLILDQPEDDLDNRLVYDLIVERLKQAKNNRQIIVVTHNANIPVNGDAEFIMSMNSESQHIEILYSGTIEDSTIKQEICDVMEGSKEAFEMRSKKYEDLE